MKNPLVTFIIGLFIGGILIWFFCCREKTEDHNFTQEEIKESEAYKNPVLYGPHEFFNRYKKNIEDAQDLFCGVKVERDLIKALIDSTSDKKDLYFVLGLDSLRNKKILIATNTSSGSWHGEDDGSAKASSPADTIWTIMTDGKGMSYLHRENADARHFLVYGKQQNNWFRNIAGSVFSSAYANVPGCTCPTCCGRTQGGNLAVQ